MTLPEVYGFLFTVCCSPEPVDTAEWIAVVFNSEDPAYKSDEKKAKIEAALLEVFAEVEAQLQANEMLMVEQSVLHQTIKSSVSNEKGLDQSKVIYQGNESGQVKHVNLATALVPAIPDLPFSAPVYSELMVAKDFPRPTCIYSNDRDVCQCYTQQATKIEVSRNSCMAYFRWGVSPDNQSYRDHQSHVWSSLVVVF